MCANNYLGLSSHPDVVAAAHKGLDTHGYGCRRYVLSFAALQDIHKELEQSNRIPRQPKNHFGPPSCMTLMPGCSRPSSP